MGSGKYLLTPSLSVSSLVEEEAIPDIVETNPSSSTTAAWIPLTPPLSTYDSGDEQEQPPETILEVLPEKDLVKIEVRQIPIRPPSSPLSKANIIFPLLLSLLVVHLSPFKPKDLLRLFFTPESPLSNTFLNPEKTVIQFYTILGNDLPPRHQGNQTYNNLEFLLQNEKPLWGPISTNPLLFPNIPRDSMPSWTIERHFILNRLTPSPAENIRSLLYEYAIPDSRIHSIDFSWDEFRKIGFNNYEGLMHGGGRWGFGNGWNESAASRLEIEGEREQLRLNGEFINEERVGWKEADWMMYERNLYVMNNNGGRNHALALGTNENDTRYILPLDSNVIFTPASLSSLLLGLIQNELSLDVPKNYITIPMHRLQSNAEYTTEFALELPKTTSDNLERRQAMVDFFKPAAEAEQQIAFRFSATERFDLKFRYGRRPKLSFLWRLGASLLPDLDKRTFSWETPDRAITAKNQGELEDETVQLAWCLRLFSGSPTQEKEDSRTMAHRAGSRIEGIVRFLESLDITAGGNDGIFNPFSHWDLPNDVDLHERDWIGLALRDHEGPESLYHKLEATFLEVPHQSYKQDFNNSSMVFLDGYAFPPSPHLSPLPPTEEDGWDFPFNPINFNPVPLIETLKYYAPSQQLRFRVLLEAQLQYLLYSKPAQRASADFLLSSPPNLISAAEYDLKVSALAVFLDKRVLVSRLAGRVGLRIAMVLDFLSSPRGGELKPDEWRKAWKEWNVTVKGLKAAKWGGWGWWMAQWGDDADPKNWDDLKNLL